MEQKGKGDIQNAMKTGASRLTRNSTQISAQPGVPQDSELKSPHTVANGIQKVNTKKNVALKMFGGFCIAAFICAVIASHTPSVDTSAAAKQALNDKISTSLSAGAILLKTDENIGGQDFGIAHKSQNNETKIWVWDYAAEDGDYVQVLVNGASIGEAFMIKHKPRTFMVPTVGEVQVMGVKDGGGGITYAVRYDVNATTYFNSAPQDEFNTYTLVRE